MAINWESGKINNVQEKLNANQKHPFVEDMQIGQVAYVDLGSLGLDKKDRLWVDPAAIALAPGRDLSEEDPQEMCGIIKTRKGYVVDVSYCEDFKLVPDAHMSFKDENWTPVRGLVATSEERIQLEVLLFERYSFVLGRSALEGAKQPKRKRS